MSLLWLTIIVIILIILLLLLFLLAYFEIPRYLCINKVCEEDLIELDKYYGCKPRVNCSSRIVISLTTIPDRIDKLGPTLYSLLAQTRRVDEIQLNVPRRSMKGKTYHIPNWLRGRTNIKIRRCNRDWGPSTKLLPTALNEEDDTCIIVVDDDIIYGSHFVQNMVGAFNRHDGEAAVTNYGNNFNTGRTSCVINYIFGDLYVDGLMGCGGYIVKVSMLPKEIYDYSDAPKEVLYVDDGWISGWLTLNRVKIYLMGSQWGTSFLPSIESLDTVALSSDFNSDGHNSDVVNAYFRNRGIWANSLESR